MDRLNENVKIGDTRSFNVYAFTKECYRCHKEVEILTYVQYADKYEDVAFPWDKERLLAGQNVRAHLHDPSIEYYGLDVLGSNLLLDDVMLKAYPKRIEKRFSKTTEDTYAMNICPHCGANQGHFFVYQEVNRKIMNDGEITIADKLRFKK